MRALLIAWGCVLEACAGTPSRGILHSAAQPAAATINPFEGDERAKQAGAKLYARECAACHGPTLGGRGRAPSLNRAAVTHAPPGALFWVLRNGSLNRGMPSFAHLPEAQRWQIITFLRAAASHAPPE